MSRSCKKQPFIKDNGKGSKQAKTYANRIYRRRISKATEPSGRKSALYRRNYESWNIHDYVSRWSYIDALREWESEERRIGAGVPPGKYGRWSWHNQFRTKDRFLNYWKKSMIRK